MQLSDAFDLHEPEVVACIGAGGKTTTCWRLWSEFHAAGQPAIFTTTTHILEPSLPPASALFLAPDPDAQRLRDVLNESRALILAASRLADAIPEVEYNPVAPARACKLAGLHPAQIDQLAQTLPGVTWLIEADGARGRSLKLPAAHEPAVPSRATCVAILAHLDALGEPLDARIAQRPEQLAAYWSLNLGERITAEHIVRLLSDPNGGLQGVPAGARAIAVLNQRAETALHPQAQSIAGALLTTGLYERVVVASLRAERPVLMVAKDRAALRSMP
ncbi:MAG TPA: selenium cofactor biosynthesis protein YqeC [Anaerolineae bacterium]|nr:selenium cofactor biosynthesis protein YqeC [Anaerolineae bacterium]